MSAPSEIYCFHCRKNSPVTDAKIECTTFESRKAKKPMERKTWVGTCSVCGNKVRQFAKKETDPAPAPAPAPEPPK